MSAHHDTLDLATKLLQREYDTIGTLTRLDGEYDDNFLVTAPDGRRCILKIMHAGCPRDVVELQVDALIHVRERDAEVAVPGLIRTTDGRALSQAGARYAWMVDFIPGVLLADFWPHDGPLLEDLGAAVARLDCALSSFEHPAMRREHQWELTRAALILSLCDHVEAPQREAVTGTLEDFASCTLPRLDNLPHGVIHNDVNDHNVLVSRDVNRQARISGLIDFGDLTWQPVVCDLAIACAYACMDKAEPLLACASVVRGYQRVRPLSGAELDVLFGLIKTRLAVSIAISSERQSRIPDDPYVTVSQKKATDTLALLRLKPEGYAQVLFHQAAGTRGAPLGDALGAYLDEAKPLPCIDIADALPPVLDLSVGSLLLGADPANLERRALGRIIDAELQRTACAVAIGRYAEPRLLYAGAAFDGIGGAERRTVHLGVDVFCAADTAVRCPLDATVELVANNARPLDYGPLVILRHAPAGGPAFYSLYGHLDPDSVARLARGAALTRGDVFARVGAPPDNGDWPPHLHVQLVVDLLGLGADYPGVCAPADRHVWLALSPNPAALLGAPDAAALDALPDDTALLEKRRALLGFNLSLAYRLPLHIVRGYGAYLYDSFGREYLDAYNNVAHVGHSHPRVVGAVHRQMALLNTNTRYLHENAIEYARRLTGKMPAGLEVCFFVNSASEANELALRLAREYTRRRDMLVVEAAYHGHTSALIDMSPYKHSGPGGRGAADWVHEVPLPDVYRGRYRRDDPAAARRYADMVAEKLSALEAANRSPAGFIAETLPSVGGQIVPPKGYLSAVYRHVRAHGGVCIADEVQTGFGRLGSVFWGFEEQDVVPDIVVLGKPIGNGFPLGAVVTTGAIATAFDNGMEYFSTFGGNPVACAAGLAVLDVVEEEGLQEKARSHGDYLLGALRDLKSSHPFVGDVRGLGLFLGIEFVTDHGSLTPAAAECSDIVNRLRDLRILAGIDGPYHNVLKLRPSMVASRADHERLVSSLDRVFAETEIGRLAADRAIGPTGDE